MSKILLSISTGKDIYASLNPENKKYKLIIHKNNSQGVPTGTGVDQYLLDSEIEVLETIQQEIYERGMQ